MADCAGRKPNGLKLEAKTWKKSSLSVAEIYSSFNTDGRLFPSGTIHFDNAPLMENIEHEWHGEKDMNLNQRPSI